MFEESYPILDEEMALDSALKNIRRQNYHIMLEIERNNLRFILKQAFTLLCELRTNLLTPKFYYTLFKQVEIELEPIYNYMKLEISRGREAWDIYESVQQCRYVIPRLYLLILSGAIYIEKEPEMCKEISEDLLEQMKEAQSPLRAMFVRYYLAKMMRGRLPDGENNAKKNGGGSINDTILFFIKNLEEMNRSWIRMTLNASTVAINLLVEKRLELNIIISDTIEILSELGGLTIDIYSKVLLPKLIEIIFMYDDSISQEFFMEYIFKHFPASYNIKNLDFILLTLSKLVQGVNKKKLFIIILEKLNNYYKENIEKKEIEEKEKILNEIHGAYPVILRNYNIIFEKQEKSVQNLISLLDMNYNFIKYCINCAPNDEQLISINQGLNSTNKILISLNISTLFQEQLNKIYEILSLALESIYSIFDMSDFIKLFNYLDYHNKKKLALEIINNLTRINSHEKLNTLEKVQNLLLYLKPLIKGLNNEEIEDNPRSIEKEQFTLIKLLSVFKTKDVNLIFMFYVEFSNFLITGGKNRRNKSLPCVISSLIIFCKNISLLYDKKITSDEKYDITFIKTDEDFFQFLSKVYNLLIDILKILEQDDPKMCIKYSLLIIQSINIINSSKEKFEEICISIFNKIFQIYNKSPPEKKYEYFIAICQNLIKNKIISEKNYNKILDELITQSKNFQKRNEQCYSLLIIAQIYFIYFKDGKKVQEFLSKAKKIADFSLTNQKNLVLFIDILNAYLYYVELDKDNLVQIKKEQIEEIIEYIQNFIVTIKNDKNCDGNFLTYIEKYLSNTINLIIERKQRDICKDIYKQIVIESENII